MELETAWGITLIIGSACEILGLVQKNLIIVLFGFAVSVTAAIMLRG